MTTETTNPRLAYAAGRPDRLAALVGELEAAGITVQSTRPAIGTKGDIFNITVLWGHGTLLLTTASSARKHIQLVRAGKR